MTTKKTITSEFPAEAEAESALRHREWHRSYIENVEQDCINLQNQNDLLKAENAKLRAVVEASIKLRNYVEECYPGLHVTDTINEALAKLEAVK